MNNAYNNEDLAAAVERAVKTAITQRDQQWMCAVEEHRRAWEQQLNKTLSQLDGQLHAVPFFQPPPIDGVQVVIQFQTDVAGPQRGFGSEAAAAKEKKRARK